MIKRGLYTLLAVLLVVGLAACGGSETNEPAGQEAQAQENGLSEAQLERGIGPV